MITFSDTLASITDDQAPLTIPVGVTNEDTLKVLDLAKAPHILYAGATGSGKSVGLNAGIATLMKRNDPSNLRFTMIDPKRVELADYRASAFVDAVITDMDEAAEALEEVLKLMERRYREFETAGVKNISSYNDRFPNKPMAYHVLVVDELADLMDTHSDTVFPILVRLGQLARAAGIHMMLATQRPAADTTPKKLVSNIPTRIGFMTQSAVESRIILGSKGAEDLKGNGDLLAQLPGTKGLVRAQGPFISEDEIKEIVAENERTIVSIPEPEMPEAAKSTVTSAKPAMPAVPAVPADVDTAEIVSQVIAQVTAQMEASAQAKVDAAEAERDEAKRKRDELADEVMSMQVKLKTTEAAMAKRVDEVRTETRKSLEAVRAADEKRVNDRLADADDAVRRATAKMRKAQGVAGRFVPWTLIGGAIASLLVAGLISVGASALAIAAPFVVGTIVALSLTNVATTEQERIDKETDNGEHLRSGAAKSGRGNAGHHTSARRADSGGSR